MARRCSLTTTTPSIQSTMRCRPKRRLTEPPSLDPADVGLALRYLSDYRVIVLIHPTGQEMVAEASAAAGWAGAHLVW